MKFNLKYFLQFIAGVFSFPILFFAVVNLLEHCRQFYWEMIGFCSNYFDWLIWCFNLSHKLPQKSWQILTFCFI